MAKKYIYADKLKKEIEKLKIDFINFHPGTDLKLVKSYLGYRSYENVLSIIDSLQQEQPSEDLEAEVRTYCKSSFKFNYDELNDSFYSNAFGFDDIAELARHFYELGKNSK